MRFDYALVATKLPEIFHALGVTLFVWIVGLVGASVLVPVILAYTGYSYWVFRGKVTEGGYH